MPHDKNGKLVEVGDIVQGRGDNIKHDIIGPVLSVTAAESCNLTIGVVQAKPLYSGAVGQLYVFNHNEVESMRMIQVGVEYGATKDFEIIQKADGTDAA